MRGRAQKLNRVERPNLRMFEHAMLCLFKKNVHFLLFFLLWRFQLAAVAGVKYACCMERVNQTYTVY